MKMGMVLVLLTVFMAMMSPSTKVSAQTNCTNVLTGLSPCFSFLTSLSSPAYLDCCSSVTNIAYTSVDCFCQFLNSGGSNLDIRFVNQTQALRLPSICGVGSNVLDQCDNVVNSPPSVPPQSNCTNSLTESLRPCFSYLTNPTSLAYLDCCSSVAVVAHTSLDCLCEFVDSGGSILDIRFVNQTRALRLPSVCGIGTNVLSQCDSGFTNPTFY
ncbi:hypothetical protein CARUB_v10015384mg [Capsella rubella]|uniref:Bifunctional inhibitor/plant lipid transfer protein/seed storage helical domain-containing protein n=1 Tax=Capsella rubella TaxID=81985 RepID=R0I6S1_9BRAS|nr:hypothetical protein CARUB_v10015384mg [Capsella rubella]